MSRREIVEHEGDSVIFEIVPLDSSTSRVRELNGDIIFILKDSIQSEGLSLRRGRYTGLRYMQLYLKFCRLHHVSRIILNDQSYIIIDGVQISLRILRMFRGQGSWYRKFGFLYYNDKRMLEIEERIRQTGIQILGLEEYEDPEFIDLVYNLDLDTIGKFMSWLLDYDLRRYVEVVNWLLEENNPTQEDFGYWLRNNVMKLEYHLS